MAILTLTANQTGRTITLLNGSTATGYFLMADSDWGNADYQTTYGGPRGKLGPRPAFAVPQLRQVKLHFRARDGAGSKDSVVSLLQAAYVVCEDVRRFGGSLLWKSSGQTRRQFADVLTCADDIDWSGNNAENLLRPEFTIALATGPYFLGDRMDTNDDFSIDTLALGNWTQDGANTFTISRGQAAPAALTLLRYRHTLKGYALGDVEVTKKILTASVITSGVWGVTAKASTTGTDTLLAAELVAGTNVIRVRKYVAGVGTDLATAAFTPAVSSTYWVRLRIEGVKITAEVYTSAPTPVATAAASAVYSATADEAARFATGHTGFRTTPASTQERYDDWSANPYVAKLIQAPEHIALVGAIPGDVAAQVDLEVTPLGGSASPVFGMAAVLERPLVNNLCWNGDFDSATIGTDGWTAAAVAGVIGAATSVARDTTAARVKYGTGDLQIACPATSDTGASFLIRRRFRRSCSYAMLVWASSAAAVTQARCKLGISGDLATPAGGLALNTNPQVFSVVWQPAADRDFAYAAFGITAATATTMNIDGVVVVENPTIVALTASVLTSATTLPVYSTPSDLPALPFNVLVDQEIYRVTATNGTTWTVDSGVEGSISSGHAAGAQVVILPPLRREYEGAGAYEPFDIIEAEGYSPTLSSFTGTAPTGATTDARGGTYLNWTGMTPGVAGFFTWLVDPALVVPDDYTLGEVDIEVWGRFSIDAAVTSLKINASCIPDGGSTKGAERFTREWGNAGHLLPLISTGRNWRFYRLGTIPMIVDRSNALRWQLKLAMTPGVAGTVNLDYLMLVPIRNRLASPTAKANDVASGSGAYPAFVPYDSGWGSTSAMTKTLRADGSGLIAELGKPGYPDHGLGRILELPAGDCDLVCKTSNLVPDDPTADNTGEMFTAAPSYAQTVHAVVTPRYALIRGS